MLISSIDAKVLQYKYAIHKIESFLPFLNSISSSSPNSLRLCHYLTLLSGTIFSINEGIFASKLDALSQFKPLKISPINISPMVSHIPYDTNDIVVSPLIDVPSVNTSIKCVKCLATLYTQCLQGYKKRLQAVGHDDSHGASHGDGRPVDLAGHSESNVTEPVSFDSLVEEIFHDDVDLVGSPNLLFELTNDVSLTNDQSFLEATLIDIDIKMIMMIVENYKKSLDYLKKTTLKFKKLKSLDLSTFDNWKLSLHKIMLITLRLNDMYVILRRFGRKAYLSNLLHLNDSKFLFLCPNSNYFKFTILKSVDDLFNQTKKNGVLIANLTRLLRQNSNFPVNSKTVLDFNNFASQGVLLIENTLSKLEEFGASWISSELKFRKTYNLSQHYLLPIQSQFTNDVHKDVVNVEKSMKKLDLDKKERSIFNRPSRSSSVSSNNSNSSASISRKPSLTINQNRNSLMVPKTTSPRQQRPNSMIFLNSNGSANSLPKNIDPPPSMAATTGRRRSNSQPQSSPERISVGSPGNSPLNTKVATSPLTSKISPASPLNSKIASSGAAAALKQKPVSRTSSISRKQPVPVKQPAIIEEKETPKKLSANQRLQLHLKQASKNGSLMTQEKEVLMPVVFDPNDPSSVNLRRHNESLSPEPVQNTPVPDPAPALPALEPVALTAPLKRKTRTEVTKMNTKRNSEMASLSSSNSESLAKLNSDLLSNDDTLSETTDVTDTTVKKVRFIGVPAYTEAEDAPTKYSARILKNFAVFKTPSKPTFKRKDQMLKKEESLLFKSQLHQQPPPSQNFLSSPLQNTKLKFKSKLT